MIIGITGCPGSGKSFLANIMTSQSWIMVDADGLGHDVVENNPDVLKELCEAFGEDIIDFDGKLKRHLVARRAFSDTEKNKKLNDIVHPVLIGRLKSRIHELRTEGKNTVVDCYCRTGMRP